MIKKTQTKIATTTSPSQSYTPGPWKVIDGIGCGSIYSIQAENPPCGNGVLAAVLHAPDKLRPLMVAQANAKLIAAAPELLAALRTLETEASSASNHVWKTPQWDGLAKAIMVARSAISKAQGGAS